MHVVMWIHMCTEMYRVYPTANARKHQDRRGLFMRKGPVTVTFQWLILCQLRTMFPELDDGTLCRTAGPPKKSWHPTTMISISASVFDAWNQFSEMFSCAGSRYLYLPLGGKNRAWLAVPVVFLFVGFWHERTGDLEEQGPHRPWNGTCNI